MKGRNKMLRKSFFLSLIVFQILISLVFAESVPPLINYQGMLMDSKNNPLEGIKKLTFNIYDSAVGGTKVWGPQLFNNVPVIKGRFNIILGTTDTKGRLIAEAFGSNNRYLGVTVGSNAEVIPRQQVLSVPYALKALHGVPPGTILSFSGKFAPDGYLFCYGQSISKENYPCLFSEIGTTYGGDGDPYFRIPDIRGRFPLGKDNMGGVSSNRVTALQADVLGNSSGEESHTLSIDEMPKHNHGNGEYKYLLRMVNGWTETKTDSTIGQPDISHTAQMIDTGDSQPHNNMPPYITINYIIKY